MAALADLLNDIWHLHRRAVVAAGMIFGLLILAGAFAVVLHASGAVAQRRDSAPISDGGAARTDPAGPSPTASDVDDWNAMTPVTAATSADYPPIPHRDRQDPSLYARAFAVELFTRDYRSDRGALLGWAQYEDSPLQSSNYPRPDWSKVLVNSLTDLSWDRATDTPVPAEGPWLALRAQQAEQTVGQVRITPDPEWERAIAGGFQPSDPLATVRDVSMRVLVTTSTAGKTDVKRFDVSIALQLGSSTRGGYGVAATNNYVIREVG